MHPVLFRVGPLTLYSYGLAIAAGFLLAASLASRRARAVGIDPALIQRIAMTGLLAGLLGGRAAYVFLNWEIYRADPLEILRLDHGGLIFYGGLLAGVLAGAAAIRAAKLPLLATLDLLMPPLAAAHAVGRIGCFLNGCCCGKRGHPTQLYEAAALAGIFILLKRLERRSPRPGTILLTYGLLYGAWRFLVEFLRGDNSPALWGLTVFQLASLPLFLLCGCILLLRRRPKK